MQVTWSSCLQQWSHRHHIPAGHQVQHAEQGKPSFWTLAVQGITNFNTTEAGTTVQCGSQGKDTTQTGQAQPPAAGLRDATRQDATV